MVYVILGMHKCGTTFTSQVLHSNGIKMIDYIPLPEELEYKYGGQYEAFTTRLINEVLLRARNLPSSKIKKIPLNDVTRMNLCAKAYIESNHNREDWGFKDPRTTLTYLDFWKGCLQDTPHTLIITYRSFESFISRVAWYNAPQKLRMAKRYIESYRECIAIAKSNNAKDCYVFDFEDLKSNTEEFLKILGLKEKGLSKSVLNKVLQRKIKLSLVDRFIMKFYARELKEIDLFVADNNSMSNSL